MYSEGRADRVVTSNKDKKIPEVVPVLAVGEDVQKELPELDVVAVVAGPVNVGRVVAVEQHLGLLVLAQDHSLLLGRLRNAGIKVVGSQPLLSDLGRIRKQNRTRSRNRRHGGHSGSPEKVEMRPEEVSGIGPDEAGKFGLGHRREIATFEIPEIKN